MEFDLENPLPTSKDKLPSLFNIENEHMPSKNYLQSLNSADFAMSIREEIVSSILHLSRDFDPFSSYLAINYMDRFLSTHSIPNGKPWILKLVAVCCTSLAFKMRKTEYSVFDLVHDGGFVFDSSTIERMEMLILGALKWRMRSVNPFSFTDYFISFFKFKDKPSVQDLKNRATEIILKSQSDVKLLEFKPSIISASALLFAAYELFPMQLRSFRDALCICTNVNKEKLLHCYDVMKDVASEGYESEELAMGSSSCTPANVLDLQCLSPSNEMSSISDDSSQLSHTHQ